MQVVTLGETMLRLSVGDGQSLEGAAAYQVDVAGAESSVAVDLARLGVPSGWVSRLPDNALGHKVANELRRHGVDVSGVVWAASGERQGTFFVQFAPSPRGTEVIYDRAGSAFSRIQPDEVDWTYVRAARWLHLSGITPALGPGPLATVGRAIEEALAAGLTISFDVNYRAKLWSPQQAAAGLAPLMEKAHVLACALRDAITLFGVGEDAEEAVRALHTRFQPAITLLTLGDQGAIAFAQSRRPPSPAPPQVRVGRSPLGNGHLYRQPAPPVETVDPLGTGDAFIAGFIAGYLEDGVQRGLAFGVGLAALKRTYRGDVVWCSRQELLATLDQAHHKSVRR
jgi:2-dehydro-3-deoxygluconokinase